MPCQHFSNADGTFAGHVCYSLEYTVTGKSGREYTFEWHDYLGPTFLTKTGKYRERIPAEAWDAFNAWWDVTIKPTIKPDKRRRIPLIDFAEAPK